MTQTPEQFYFQNLPNYRALHALGMWPFAEAPSPAITGESLTRLIQQIRAWQKDNKLDADGKLGPAGWAVLRKSVPPLALPIPKGYAQVRSVYGDFKYTDKPGATVVPEPSWSKRFKLVDTPAGKVRFLDVIAQEFAHLLTIACKASGYTPKSVQTYVPRHKRGGGNDPDDESPDDLSMHCWCAFDVDPSANPWGNKPNSPVVKYPVFAAVFRVSGWSCGCDWKNPDTMHFQRARGC